MPAPLSAQVLLALVPVPFSVPSVYLCLCLSLICIINIDVLSPVSTCSLFCCHCLFSVRRPNELHSPRLKSLSRLILHYIDTYTPHLHTYRYIYSIGSCLGSVCKCNCNSSCSLWIMKDESNRLGSSWTVSLLEPICTELDSCFPYSIFPFPPILISSVSLQVCCNQLSTTT